MVKKFTRAASCEGKASFESAVLARDIVQRMHKHGTVAMIAYRCKYCSGWHIGQLLSRYRDRKPRPDQEEDYA